MGRTVETCSQGCRDGACVITNRTGYCGDGIIQSPPEECEINGQFLGNASCSMFPMGSGSLSCWAPGEQFECRINWRGCGWCGNGACGEGEDSKSLVSMETSGGVNSISL